MAKKKTAAKKAAKAAEKTARKHPKLFLALVAAVLILAIVAGVSWYFLVYRKPSPPAGEGETGELSIHFLELGNKYNGDSVFMKIGDTEILVDGGSRENSADTIEAYVKDYCTDGILEYVIVTHADQDHIAALAGNSTYKSLFERFRCETIIDFPRTNKNTQVYRRYVAARDAEVGEGAKHYTALQCYRGEDGAQRSYTLVEGVTLNFLYNYYYDHDTDDENNYSVCFYITQGANHYLFTGDLEAEGEEYLVANNTLPQCKLYKAGHHGSKTSSTDALLSVVRPEFVCVCCVAGSTEYTTNRNNTFPTQAMIDRVARYTSSIYVTSLFSEEEGTAVSLNGTIVVRSDGVNFTVEGSNNSLPLKETEWFAANRVWPSNGVN